MQYSKLLFLYLFVALAAAIPVPLFENLFGNNENGNSQGGLLSSVFGNKNNSNGLFGIFNKNNDAEVNSQASAQTSYDDVSIPATTTTTAPVEGSANAGFDLKNIPEDADIASLVTDGVSNLIRTNLCSTLNNAGVNNLCENISAKVTSAISGILNKVIKSSINSATGNTLTIACAILPSEVFQQLEGTIKNVISSQISKINDANVSTIANNILTVIVNTVSNLLCNKGSTNSSGNVIIDNISNLFNSITQKANNINSSVASYMQDGNQYGNSDSQNIANGIANVQKAIKMEYNNSYQTQSNNYQNQSNRSNSYYYNQY